MYSDIVLFLRKHNRMTKMTLGLSVFIILILYYLVNIMYSNYQINQRISSTQQEIANLNENNLEQENKILYYTTHAYIEKTLREKLGYQKEGERVYALTRKDPAREKLIEEQRRYQEREDGKPNIVRWWDFFFVSQAVKAPIEEKQLPLRINQEQTK